MQTDWQFWVCCKCCHFLPINPRRDHSFFAPARRFCCWPDRSCCSSLSISCTPTAAGWCEPMPWLALSRTSCSMPASGAIALRLPQRPRRSHLCLFRESFESLGDAREAATQSATAVKARAAFNDKSARAIIQVANRRLISSDFGVETERWARDLSFNAETADEGDLETCSCCMCLSARGSGCKWKNREIEILLVYCTVS